jgi:aminoglycoside 6-adenylyltransferase
MLMEKRRGVEMNSEVDKLYEGLVERFARWSETQSDVRAIAIVGSRARVGQPADEWADLDILVLTSNPERYLKETDWIKNIGDYWLTFLEPTAAGNETECRVLFQGGLDVDFAIFPLRAFEGFDKNEMSPEFMEAAKDTFERGVRILVDKDKRLAQFFNKISSTEKAQPHPPSEHDFLQVVHDFLYHAVWTVKHLRRGELWWAKMCSDCYMQHLLLRMVEWHAQAMHNWDYDTWFRGRFLEKWADPRVIEGLHGAFAHYDVNDVSHALLEELKLFRWTSRETAGKLKYKYPTEADDRVMEWIMAHLPRNSR